MKIDKMIKSLFENQTATGYRKSNPNMRFDLKEIGFMSRHITAPDEKPSTDLKDYFLRRIEGNLVRGEYNISLKDIFADDFEIEIPFSKEDKTLLNSPQKDPKQLINICYFNSGSDAPINIPISRMALRSQESTIIDEELLVEKEDVVYLIGLLFDIGDYEATEHFITQCHDSAIDFINMFRNVDNLNDIHIHEHRSFESAYNHALILKSHCKLYK